MKLRLELTNNTTKTTTNYEVIDYFSSNIFFHFEIRLKSGIIDGEYTYHLYDGDVLVANGLCQIGDYKAEVKEYKENKNKEKTYKVYGK
jgi:hypothetical protein